MHLLLRSPSLASPSHLSDDTTYTLPHSPTTTPALPLVSAHRLILGYKSLPYTVKYIEYTEIETHLAPLGGKPTSTKPDGSPFYTLPAILDSTTSGENVCVIDSIEIAKYLDERYEKSKYKYRFVWVGG